MPELSELDVMRHFTELSPLNFGVDTGFYPLGSCTMKYNPKVAERRRAAGLPLPAPAASRRRLVQGALEVPLRDGAGPPRSPGWPPTLQPLAGAHGELTA